jgi:hypothetical protein
MRKGTLARRRVTSIVILIPPGLGRELSHLFGETARGSLHSMGYLGTPGRDPRVNQQIAEEQHQVEQERAREAHIADQVHPTWWQRLLRRLKHETPETEA